MRDDDPPRPARPSSAEGADARLGAADDELLDLGRAFVERHHPCVPEVLRDRDARVMTLYEGTSQIQKLIIGRAETGISAFG